DAEPGLLEDVPGVLLVVHQSPDEVEQPFFPGTDQFLQGGLLAAPATQGQQLLINRFRRAPHALVSSRAYPYRPARQQSGSKGSRNSMPLQRPSPEDRGSMLLASWIPPGVLHFRALAFLEENAAAGDLRLNGTELARIEEEFPLSPRPRN